MRRRSLIRLGISTSAVIVPLVVAICLSGAAAQDSSGARAPKPVVATTSQRDVQKNETPRIEGDGGNTGPNQPGMQVFQGSGTFVNPPAPIQKADQAGDVTLDFSDADIREVVRVIFGDILQKSYTIDPKVTGRITLETGKPISKESVLTALETALEASGAAISLTQGVYNIVPIADVHHSAQTFYGSSNSQAPGYGVEVVPLEFVSAEEMQHVLTPLIPEGGIVQIDSQRNLIFIAGTEPERAAIRETIARFDVDYFKGMSFALIRPSHADAETLAGELDKIFDAANSPISGLLRLVPVPRINDLLVITSRPNYLEEVQRWVRRLDIAPVTPDRKLYFYRLQNTRAQDVAETLRRLFGASVVGSPSDTSTPTTSTGGNSLPNGGVGTMGYGGGGTMMTGGPGSFVTPQTQPRQPTSTFGSAGAVRNVNATTSGPQIVTDDANNALIIRADAADYAAIEDVIQKMDVTPSQVLVEATIVEVTLNDTLQYGVEWYFQNKSGTITANQSQVQNPTSMVVPQFPGLGITYTGTNVNAALSTLGALTNIKVLSSPKILTLDNKPAMIEVGDQIPIVTQTSVATTAANAPVVSSIEQRNTGVILTVTPRIGSGGIVYLDVTQEVSSSTPTTTSGIDSPTIQERRIQTSVAINDGATIVLGGLIQRSDTTSNSGIPYLKDIPLLGSLFGTRSSVRGRTELLVFLTPHVIRNLPAALDATERLKKEMADIQEAMDDFEEQRVPRRPW